MIDPDSKTHTLPVRTSPAADPDTFAALHQELASGEPSPRSSSLSSDDRPSLLSALEASTSQPRVDPRFVEREPLGEGGMGKVLRVQDRDLKRDVAKKVLLNDHQFNRFIEEAQITSQLEHPGVLPVHDFGVDRDGNLFFTMQLIPSRVTLEELIQGLREGDERLRERYTFERRVQLIQQVCHVLHYAHDRGVIHRDLKPSNIMVGEHGEVFLVDWGIAKLVAAEAERAPPETHRPPGVESGPGTIMGTPAYMAPEQLLGDQNLIERATDTYALTAVLYELLTLHHYLGEPRPGGRELVARVAAAKPVDAESYRDPRHGRVPRILSRICRKGLSKRKEERYPTAAALEQVLQRWLEGRAPIVCPGTGIQRWLGRYSDLIDEHPTLVPWLTILVALAGVVGVVVLAVT